MSRRTDAELAAYWAIDPGVYEAGREWQREADAALADQTAQMHEDMQRGTGLTEAELVGHRAIAVAMRSLARQIRGGA